MAFITHYTLQCLFNDNQLYLWKHTYWNLWHLYESEQEHKSVSHYQYRMLWLPMSNYWANAKSTTFYSSDLHFIGIITFLWLHLRHTLCYYFGKMFFLFYTLQIWLSDPVQKLFVKLKCHFKFSALMNKIKCTVRAPPPQILENILAFLGRHIFKSSFNPSLLTPI